MAVQAAATNGLLGGADAQTRERFPTDESDSIHPSVGVSK